MTIEPTRAELEVEMARHDRPLTHALKESIHEWACGEWSLSKFSTTWRIGWAHKLRAQAKWATFRFAWFGTTLIGLVFDSGGDEPAWYMPGWVREDNAAVAEGWVAFLNREIASRLAGEVSPYDGRIGLEDAFQNAITSAEIEAEHRAGERGYQASSRVKALFQKVDRQLSDERPLAGTESTKTEPAKEPK